MSMTTRCPHCGTTTSPGPLCVECGWALPSNPIGSPVVGDSMPSSLSGPRVVGDSIAAATGAGRRLQTANLGKARRDTVIILLLAVVELVYQTLEPGAAKPQHETVLLATGFGMATVLLAFVAWAWVQPFPAAATGLALFAGVHLLHAIVEPETLLECLLAKVAVVGGFLHAVVAGSRHRRLLRTQPEPTPYRCDVPRLVAAARCESRRASPGADDGNAEWLLVEHVFRTTLDSSEVLRRAREFLTSRGFALQSHHRPTFDGSAVTLARGYAASRRSRTMVQLPQEVQIELLRGQVAVAASSQPRDYSLSGDSTHPLSGDCPEAKPYVDQLKAIVAGLELLLARHNGPEEAGLRWDATENALVERIRRQLRMWRIVRCVALIIVAPLLGLLVWCIVQSLLAPGF